MTTFQGDDTMRTRTILLTSAVLGLGALLGGLAATGWLTTARAQDQTANPTAAPATGGTPEVLPRPDFHFPGNVGRTILDSEFRYAEQRRDHTRPTTLDDGTHAGSDFCFLSSDH
jgi:hypothetical protein